MVHSQWFLIFLLVFVLEISTADPPFLFPHGYFDSTKLKPFDAIYLNLMAQSNLEYGGVTLEELDELDKTRELVAGPPKLPRTGEEDDILLHRGPLPLDTGSEEGETAERLPNKHLTVLDGSIKAIYAIAPGPKDPRDWRPPIPFSRIANGLSSIGAAHDGEAKLKTTPPPTSDSTTASPDAKSLRQPSKAAEKRPPSPFRLIQRLQRRYRRAAADEDNPFEDIATRPPPRDQVQMQRVRTYLRRHRKTKKNKRRKFLTRDDIYDPHRNERPRLTKEERRKLREELALKPTSAETEDLPPVKPKQALEERHMRRPVHTGGRILPKDPSTTQEPRIMPTLIPMVDHQLPRLRNNPYRAYDITKPTVIALPIPPNITN